MVYLSLPGALLAEFLQAAIFVNSEADTQYSWPRALHVISSVLDCI